MANLLLLGLVCVSSLHISTVFGIPCPPGKSFPHPLNCEDFYLCDPVGNHKHFTCPLGLHFNAAKEACDWPLNANCSTNATQTIIGSKIAQAVNKSTTEEREKPSEESSFEGSLFDKVKGILGLGGSTEPSEKAIKFEIGEILPEKEDSNKSKEIILNHLNLTKVGLKKEDEHNITKVDTLMSKNQSENGSVVSHPSHEGVPSISSTNQPLTKQNQEAHSKDLLKEKRDASDSTTPKHVEEEKKKKLTKGDGKILSEQPTKEDLKPKKSNNKNKDSVKNEEKGLKESKSENKDEELETNPFHFSRTYKEIEENPIFHIYSLNDTERVFGKISGYKEWEELVDETTGKDIDDDNVTNISVTTGDSKDKSTDEQPSEW